MIDQLIAIADELSGELFSFISAHLPGRVRGAMLGVDRLWLESYLRSRLDLPGRAPYYFEDSAIDIIQHLQVFDPDPIFFPDNGHVAKVWEDRCKVMGYPINSQPVYIKVILRHQLDTMSSDLPRQFRGYPLIYEYRPPCVALSWANRIVDRLLNREQGLFSSSSNVSIGQANPNTAGTLGGFLRCPQTGKLYGVSCAHVLGQGRTEMAAYHPGPYEGKSTDIIGQVKLSTLPVPLSSGSECSYNPNESSQRLDLAVAEIIADHNKTLTTMSAAKIAHAKPIKSLSVYEKVLFHGKVSGWVKAEIQHLSLWHEIMFGDQPRCFGRIFDITHRRPVYINTDICKPGDSGAWVLSESGGMVCWDGMLFAGDGLHGYCCFAEYILEATTNSPAFPYGLTLLS